MRGHSRMVMSDLALSEDQLLPERDYTDSGLSAEERGWVVEDEEHFRQLRAQRRRKLISQEREVEVLRRYHRGDEVDDIAADLGISVSTVHNSVQRSLKRTLNHVGAQQERERQMHLLDGVVGRLNELIFPSPDADGVVRKPSIAAVDMLLKALDRRAKLTGADMPAQVHVEAELNHTVAMQTVERVNEWMEVIDEVAASGYGSGRVDESQVIEGRVKELEAGEVDLRPLAERVADTQLPAQLFPDPEPERDLAGNISKTHLHPVE